MKNNKRHEIFRVRAIIRCFEGGEIRHFRHTKIIFMTEGIAAFRHPTAVLFIEKPFHLPIVLTYC
jgi:hypothetical protein